MYSYNDFIAVANKAKELALKYISRYEELYSKCSNEYLTPYRSGRTIHNLKESIRPDLMSLHKDMRFFDFSSTWRIKKQRMYKISTSADGQIQSICAGDTYKEFWIYENGGIILADYSSSEKNGKFSLESLGYGTYENDKLVSFFVAEIEHIYSEDIDFHMICEHYDYSDNLLSTITTYDYQSTQKITLDENSQNKLGCIRLKSGTGIMANPSIYIDTFKYDENNFLREIERRVSYDQNVGTAIINIKQQTI